MPLEFLKSALLYIIISAIGTIIIVSMFVSQPPEKPPDEFRYMDIWRPYTVPIPSPEDRFLLQWEWTRNISTSGYLKATKSKKRILTTGGKFYEFDNKNATGLFRCLGGEFSLDDYCEIVRETGHSNNNDVWNIDALFIKKDSRPTGMEPYVPPGIPTFVSLMEPPWILQHGDFRYNNPILASYWRGSDIVIPYSKWMPERHKKPQPPKNYAMGKTKMGVIAVSDCRTPNHRLDYVAKLQKHMGVDVYGKCGKLKCPRTDECFKKLANKYKFYLAFENSNCRDYITEKFFNNGLGYDWIPVVMGAHPDDYKAVGPPHSYIHVDDFPTPKDLAEYLHYLDKNDTAYNAYFSWRGTGEFVATQEELFCRVCGYLYYYDFNKECQ